MKSIINSAELELSKIPALINNRVYILTNDAILGNTLVQHLGPENYQLKIFPSVSEMESASQKAQPAAILLDIMNTPGDGVDEETIIGLKQRLQPCPPIICLSSADDIHSRLAAARAGSARYFTPPLDLGGLSRTLRRFGTTNPQEAYRVLYIDDDENMLALLANQLRRADMEVETLNDPRQALETLKDFQPDLLLLDVHMPELSGAELAIVIRQDDSFAQLPIIFLSMDDNPNQQMAVMDLGGDEFLSKQIDTRRLVARIKEQIKRARESRRINKGLQEALWNSELRRFALDNHAIVSAADVNGNITYVNDTFCRISGYSRDELLGKNHRLLKSGHHSAAFYAEMWDTIAQGKTWQGIVCNLGKDGSEYWVESTIVPFLDSSGLPYQYVSVRTDITALRASEERLHRSQVFANIGTWDWNIQTGELYWSERIGPLFGHQQTIPETTYENFLAAVHPEDRQRVTAAIERCVEQGEDYDIEHRVVWPDGSIHWMMERGDVVRDEHGTALHMLGVVQDITQRKQMESQLLKHKAAMDSSLEGIAIIDVSGRYCYLNPAFAQIYGYSRVSDMVGQYWSMHYGANELLRFEEEIMNSLIINHKWSGEAIGVRKDGNPFPQLLSLSMLDDGDLVCIVHDISTAKQSEAEMIAAKEAAEKASQTKSQFLSSMSHELRTPMNAIIGFSQLLDLEPLNDTQRDNVNEILKASSHLLELINEVLDLSRVEAGRLELNIEDITLCHVIEECLALISPLAEQRDIKIDIAHDGENISLEQGQKLGAVIRADRVRLKQALINLLSNAVKYNRQHGRVTIECHAVDNGRIRISIRDTGPGIDQELQSQLFQPFNRLGAENSETEGTGIGLVYTKKIIELMNGSVGVDSIPGEGSTFWIDVPGYYCQSAADSIELEQTAPPASNNETGKQYNVLYVEDNPANMRLMEQVLNRRSNINLLEAHEPLLGLQLATQHRPDLIMLDINLPGMSGYDVLQILQQNEEMQEIPVVAISANAMPCDIQKGLDAGFAHFITKPIKVQELLDIIDKLFAENSTTA